ncbi:YgjV family protein [uncultured Methanobrevibacter sp.]|uniref:YgjV family protein n=1 Tax=uncultured Methanobrevibacter sp. TaxID=253161 RepID=UPI00262AA432|nr:YgjV family protein [uncultured Methanobrevibacter sp.]
MIDLPWNIIVGNIISLVAGIFLILSMWVNDEKRAYKHQFLNAFVLMISSIFFLSWTGVTTMAIAATRNIFVYKGKLTLSWTIFFIILSVALGLMVNTMGVIGLLPIIAIVQITICNYALKSIKWIKLSFIVNEIFYIIYFIAILDFASSAIELFTALVGVYSWVKLIKNES